MHVRFRIQNYCYQSLYECDAINLLRGAIHRREATVEELAYCDCACMNTVIQTHLYFY